MFLYDKGIKDNFAAIAEHHWQGLLAVKPGTKGVQYHPRSLVHRIKPLASARGRAAAFFGDLLANNNQLLHKIITGNPWELQNVITDFNAEIKAGHYPPLLKKGRYNNALTSFAKNIQQIFSYDRFSKKQNSWCAYGLCDMLGIRVCPYCNRNYTFTLSVKDNGIVRPELDHFLPKSKFPYLALSFYNLVPSCHICNSNLKHSHNFDLENYLHPYLNSLDETVSFTVKFKKNQARNLATFNKHYGVGFFYGDGTGFSIRIKAKIQDTGLLKKVIRNIQVFRIRELYNSHKDIVQDIILSAYVYNEEYIQSLMDDYKGQLFRNREDVLRFIMQNHPSPDGMKNRPFSKLSKDIYEEFGIKF